MSKVRGEYVSVALIGAAAAPDSVDERTTECDVPELGRARFYFKRFTSNKGKTRHTFWTAEQAVIVQPE